MKSQIMLVRVFYLMLGLSLAGVTTWVYAQSGGWQILQQDDRLHIRQAQEDKVIINRDGSLGIGVVPGDHEILALEDSSRAWLVHKIADISAITNPAFGMMVYDSAPTQDCFRFYTQLDGGWSSCMGLGKLIPVRLQDISDSAGAKGDLYFSQTRQALQIHDGVAFVSLGLPILNLGATNPTDTTQGRLFFNTVSQSLLVWDGASWVPVKKDFEDLVASGVGCHTEKIEFGETQWACPDHTLLSGIHFKPNTRTPDFIECCQAHFGAFYWDFSAWGTCTDVGALACEGTQNRTLSCHDANGDVVEEAWCDPARKPAQEQSCLLEDCPVWTTQAWEACRRGSGIDHQARSVWCGQSGQVVSGTLCAGGGPSVLQSCVFLSASDNHYCAEDGVFVIPGSEWDDLDESIELYGRDGNQVFLDWSRCDQQKVVINTLEGGSRLNFKPPPRNGSLTLTLEVGSVNQYALDYAANITGNLPSSLEGNQTYVFICAFDGNAYNCHVN